MSLPTPLPTSLPGTGSTSPATAFALARSGRVASRGAPRSSRRPVPAPSSPAAADLLAAARRGLTAATLADTAAERYASAHLAALRTAAAVLATRALPHRGSRNAWVLLARHAPELAEWAGFFAANAAKRSAIDAGRTSVVTLREADDLLRDAETFLSLVEGLLLRGGALDSAPRQLPTAAAVP